MECGANRKPADNLCLRAEEVIHPSISDFTAEQAASVVEKQAVMPSLTREEFLVKRAEFWLGQDLAGDFEALIKTSPSFRQMNMIEEV